MILELKEYNVEIKNELTFGDMEDIQEAIGNDNQTLKGNAKLIELAVTCVKDKEGKEIQFSNNWRRNLSIDDGMKLTLETQKLVSNIENLVKKD